VERKSHRQVVIAGRACGVTYMVEVLVGRMCSRT
jgi:hypothetical protein